MKRLSGRIVMAVVEVKYELAHRGSAALMARDAVACDTLLFCLVISAPAEEKIISYGSTPHTKC